jgi:hypothetical protein
MTAHIDPTLEALRVQRDAYVTSGEEAAVIYDKLRDELVLTRQRFPIRRSSSPPPASIYGPL